MKTSRFSGAQIMGIMAQAENGVPVSEFCRDHGLSTVSFYEYRAKFGGMDASMVSQMKSIDDENKEIAVWLVKLTGANTGWGLGLC